MLDIVLDGERLTIEDVVAVAYALPGEITLRLSAEATAKVSRARAAVEQFVAEGRIIYGITTGFGAFKDRFIPADQVRDLQRNIVMSHSVGVGAPFETPIVRAMMLIRANTLAKGHSGIRRRFLPCSCGCWSAACTRSCRSKGRWARRVTWRRWRTSP